MRGPHRIAAAVVFGVASTSMLACTTAPPVRAAAPPRQAPRASETPATQNLNTETLPAATVARIRGALVARERAAHACYMGFDCEAPPVMVALDDDTLAALDNAVWTDLMGRTGAQAATFQQAVCGAVVADAWAAATARSQDATFEHRGVPLYVHDIEALVASAQDEAQRRELLAAAAASSVIAARRSAFFSLLSRPAKRVGRTPHDLLMMTRGPAAADARAVSAAPPMTTTAPPLSDAVTLRVFPTERHAQQPAHSVPASVLIDDNVELTVKDMLGCFLVDPPQKVVVVAPVQGRGAPWRYAVACGAAGRQVHIEDRHIVHAWAMHVAGSSLPTKDAQARSALARAAARFWSDSAVTRAMFDREVSSAVGSAETVTGISLLLGDQPVRALFDARALTIDFADAQDATSGVRAARTQRAAAVR